MTLKKLDEQLECKVCGTIQQEIPENPEDDTPIRCSNCGAYLGTWREMEVSFSRQAKGGGVFDLKEGTIIKKT
ncbi:hypothetical protein [Mesorhizobium sp. SP-1A]|uniref:hypothetical protein n=1 Tax=Mesorhizobium sp. SP-1A TaxID=3077840 RepID=UPI0028F6CA68|nr:hypothetical protein [Mesorhizobium sp. SP-1A]